MIALAVLNCGGPPGISGAGIGWALAAGTTARVADLVGRGLALLKHPHLGVVRDEGSTWNDGEQHRC